MGRLAVQDNHTLNAGLDGVDAGLDLRDHAAGNRTVLDEGAGLRDGEFLDEFLVLVKNAGNIREKQQTRGVKRTGNGAGKCIGVDVVGCAIAAGRDGGDNRNHLRFGKQIEQGAVDFHHFADKTEIEHALDVAVWVDHRLFCLFGEDHVAILTAQADGPFAGLVDEGDDFLVDRAGQNHFNDLDRLGVGNAQAALELRFNAHLAQHRTDLRTAAMHDDGVDAGLLQKGDVFRESLPERGITHGVTAIFYHDGLVFVFLHERQSLCEQPRLSFAFGRRHLKTSVCGCGR
ncbi:hypothetical protein AT6N2_C2157 [Agrobacterium tumefaciens]|nr:hypothetical protein AT6N2_C2157 [Agrobacterium tumefaciens]